jgi:hypothetical protein
MLYMQHTKLRRQQQQHPQQPSVDSEAADGIGAAMLRPDSGQHGRPFTTDSANSGHVDAAERGDLDQDQLQLLPPFEPRPMVPPEKLRAWLLAQQGKQQQWGGAEVAAGAAAAGVAAGAAAGNAAAGAVLGAMYGGGGGSSSDSSCATLQFSEQLARDMDPVHGNPNIKE